MNQKKLFLIVAASPRKEGNSTLLALQAAKGIEKEGAKVDFVTIGTLNIAPCNGCDLCISHPEEGCVIKDDMQPLYQKIKDARGIIFATPIYWFNISAQMKAFIDRAYAIQGEDYYAFSGKNVGVILTYGDSDVFNSGGINAIRSFQDIFSYVNANLVGMVYGSADKPGEIQNNLDLLQKAFDLGKKLART
jgi:multimeric flavodoxin WrbA